MLRRAFLSAFRDLTSVAAIAPAAAQDTKPDSNPAMHAQDDWLDRAPRKHRAVFDTWMADKFGEALGFAGNWIRYNKEGYGLADGELAVVIVARHGTTPFAFNEAMWAKYGTIFAKNMSANDKEKRPNPTTNIYAARLTTLSSSGLRLAVCQLTTRAYTDIIARETGAEHEAIMKELTGNAIGEAHFVPAGIIAFTRAQERGYAAVSIG